MSGWRKRTIMDMASEANLPACHTTHPKALERFAKLVQAQRTWVGLTNEDIALIDWESLVTKKDCVRAIDAKLKEKNT